jgi:hypothetical protein
MFVQCLTFRPLPARNYPVSRVKDGIEAHFVIPEYDLHGFEGYFEFFGQVMDSRTFVQLVFLSALKPLPVLLPVKKHRPLTFIVGCPISELGLPTSLKKCDFSLPHVGQIQSSGRSL